MGNYYATQPSSINNEPAASLPPLARLFQALLALGSGLALFFVLMGGFGAYYTSSHAGEMFPGVSVAGVDLSGRTVDEATVLVAAQLSYPTTGQVAFQDGPKVWIAHPQDLGMYLDLGTTMQNAYNVGRTGSLPERVTSQIEAYYQGVNLPPVYVYDQNTSLAYLRNIANQVDKPIVEASISVNGIDVSVQSGQVGRKVDIMAMLPAVEKQMQTQTDGLIPLVVQETPPVILDASAQADIARKILSAPLVIQVPDAVKGDPGPWTYDPPALSQMLSIERVDTSEGTRYQVGLNPDTLRPMLEDLAPKLARNPQNARFTFNDDTHQLQVIQNSITGRSLDVDASLQAINQKAAEGEHTINLAVSYTQPDVADTATAEQLGITQLVSSHTSYFYGSATDRVKNIKTASARFHGLLVAPGATFSMADVLGDVSLENGYAEALIIFGDRTIKGVGGGVCQVSTTLFRTAFLGGYPIVERNPHAYRVGYYEQTPSGGHDPKLAGLDATVFVPVVDFKFRNYSQSWLLMETYVSNNSLTWKFYSTSDGRQVSYDSTGPQNIVDPPEPSYEENPALAKGEIKQVDYAAQGADVSITRTVTLNGQVLFTDMVNTHYLPWRAIYQYGPGTEDIPTPEPTP